MYGSLALYNRIADYGDILYGQCPGYGYFGGSGPAGYFFYGGHYMMLLIIILLIIAIYLIVKNAHYKKGGEVSENPVDIIKRRYARGEITKEQFENLKRDLSG